jgi:hypothetical protein
MFTGVEAVTKGQVRDFADNASLARDESLQSGMERSHDAEVIRSSRRQDYDDVSSCDERWRLGVKSSMNRPASRADRGACSDTCTIEQPLWQRIFFFLSWIRASISAYPFTVSDLRRFAVASDVARPSGSQTPARIAVDSVTPKVTTVRDDIGYPPLRSPTNSYASSFDDS